MLRVNNAGFVCYKKYPFLKERHIFQKRTLFVSSFSFRSNKIWGQQLNARVFFFSFKFSFFQLIYSIVSGDPEGQLNMTTVNNDGKYFGVITVAKLLDRETKDVYKLNLTRTYFIN